MITFFVCLLLFFSFSFVKFFSFKMMKKKKKKKKTDIPPEISPIILCFLKVTLRLTLSKPSKLLVSKYFLIYVVVQFYPWFKVYFPLFCGQVW